MVAAFAGCAVATIVVDQLIKAIVTVVLVPTDESDYGLVHRVNQSSPISTNPGAAAALMACIGVMALVGGVVLTIGSTLLPVGFGMAIGGAGSNLIDAATRHEIVDYIGIGKSRAINLADAAIAIGSVTAAVGLLLDMAPK